MEPVYFATPEQLRAYFQQHHTSASELRVGFYKKTSKQPSITWPEAVDQALCFGWIDGVRKNVDDTRYSIRFTPRRGKSIWSTVNVNRVTELTAQGLMTPEGLSAFETRIPKKSGIYSYEQKQAATLSIPDERLFRAYTKAWDYFQSQPPGYRHLAIWRVISAKKEETRKNRLAALIAASEKGKRL